MQYTIQMFMQAWKEMEQWNTPTPEKGIAFVATELGETVRAMLADGHLEEMPAPLARVIIGMGEMVEAWLREDDSFTRNNPEYDGWQYDGNDVVDLAVYMDAVMGHYNKWQPVGKTPEELGDVAFMTYVTAIALDVDLKAQVMSKLEGMHAKKVLDHELPNE